MFESLSNRLQDVFKTLRGETRLTPENVEAALREIRLALLEADVNFKVVKAFVDRVRDRALGQDVLRSLSPSQQVVKIVRDEMVALFGDTEGGLKPSTKRPRVILLNKIRYNIEGLPVFEADQGDIVYVPKMRYHLASFAGTGPSCRLAMNGYVDLSHSFDAEEAR